MQPGASVSGCLLQPPPGPVLRRRSLGRDQIEAYADRKGWSIADVEKWLAPNLGYDPDD